MVLERRKIEGFTLIELSLVIVIIGLIVAGVVGGQSLINQAKLRGLIADVNKYELAINAFKLEYGDLPGDFARANDFGLGASGNGDRQITDLDSFPEAAWFLPHMSNAGLIEGNYPTALPHANGHSFQIGKNKIRLTYSDNVTFYVVYTGLSSLTKSPTHCHSWAYNGLYRDWYGNALDVGAVDTPAGFPKGAGRSWLGFLSVKDAQSIESKIDDGEPGTGRLVVTGSASNTPSCTNRTLQQALPVSFDFTDTSKSCRLFYKL